VRMSDAYFKPADLEAVEKLNKIIKIEKNIFVLNKSNLRISVK